MIGQHIMQTISVIIPAYNYARYLNQAIESVLGQTLSPHEVIVVDDGSTDDTATVLAAYRERVCVLRQPNQGVAAARNYGARTATGELLAFLDADDYWLHHKLELQRDRFLADPDLGLVHCGYEEVDVSGNMLGHKYLQGLEGWVADEMLLFSRPVILGGGSGFLLPRKTFFTLGGFDERLSTSADWDLFQRIARRARVGFVPEVLLRYRRHGSNMHGNVRAMEHDMLLAYQKAFAEGGPALRHLRRRCYGNLHTALAGSFLAAGQPWACLRHAAQGLLLTPQNLTRYLAYPLRWWRRRFCRPSISRDQQ